MRSLEEGLEAAHDIMTQVRTTHTCKIITAVHHYETEVLLLTWVTQTFS